MKTVGEAVADAAESEGVHTLYLTDSQAHAALRALENVALDDRAAAEVHARLTRLLD